MATSTIPSSIPNTTVPTVAQIQQWVKDVGAKNAINLTGATKPEDIQVQQEVSQAYTNFQKALQDPFGYGQSIQGKDAAQTWSNFRTAFNNEFGGPFGYGGVSGTANSIVNSISSWQDAVKAIGTVFGDITSGEFWLRVGEILAGAFLIYLGIKTLSSSTPTQQLVQSVSPSNALRSNVSSRPRRSRVARPANTANRPALGSPERPIQATTRRPNRVESATYKARTQTPNPTPRPAYVNSTATELP